MEEELLIAATIGAPRGLKGEVALNLHTDRPEQVFTKGATLQTDDTEFPTLTVKSARPQGNRMFATFEEFNDRTAAEGLVGTQLFVEPEEESDAWYPKQLQGLTVQSSAGETLGTVTDLVAGTAHDFLLVDVGGEEVMVPFVLALVPTVDVEGGIVVVDAPDGLFPDGSSEDKSLDAASDPAASSAPAGSSDAPSDAQKG
mgnify:CR=1 FL=1